MGLMKWAGPRQNFANPGDLVETSAKLHAVHLLTKRSP